mgnify:CR=1 FL=1
MERAGRRVKENIPEYLEVSGKGEYQPHDRLHIAFNDITAPDLMHFYLTLKTEEYIYIPVLTLSYV